MLSAAACMARSTFRFAVTAIVATIVVAPPAASAQNHPPSLLQVEVADSIGLPLPDAKIEVFTLMDGGVFWEWIVVAPSQLPPGISLLRFSHPGYRSATFSVPLREGSKVALRVRLDAPRDTTTPGDALDAREVHAIGMAVEGRMKTDIIGRRRILDHGFGGEENATRFGSLLRRARGTELLVLPTSAGTYRPFAETVGGSRNCPMLVMMNGDRREVLPFAAFDELYSTSEVEAIEVFPRGTSLPTAYQVQGSGCGMLVVWFRSL
jgi:hypothetical protein